MEFKKLIKHHGLKLAIACALLSFILFIPACITQSNTLRTCLIVLVLLFLAVGCLLIFFWNRTREMRVHYFLFDRRRDRMRQSSDLTPDAVADAMNYYLAPFTASPLELFTEIPKQLRLQLEGEPQFKPLVAYHMLNALSATDEEQLLLSFSTSDQRAITYICRALEDAGDGEMADFIYHLRKNAETEAKRIPSFFKRNEKWFFVRPLRYINRNFEKFYVEKSRFKK